MSHTALCFLPTVSSLSFVHQGLKYQRKCQKEREEETKRDLYSSPTVIENELGKFCAIYFWRELYKIIKVIINK